MIVTGGIRVGFLAVATPSMCFSLLLANACTGRMWQRVGDRGQFIAGCAFVFLYSIKPRTGITRLWVSKFQSFYPECCVHLAA